MTNEIRDTIDLSPYRWWVFAKNEEQARQVIRQTRERNEALRLDPNWGLVLL